MCFVVVLKYPRDGPIGRIFLCSEKVSMPLFELSGLHEDLVLPVDLDQSLKLAASFLEIPCAFHCAAPAGGKGEVVNPVGTEAFDQSFLILIAVGVCKVNVVIAASFHVSVKTDQVCVSLAFCPDRFLEILISLPDLGLLCLIVCLLCLGECCLKL